MKTFKMFVEQQGLPLLQLHPTKDNSLIVNEDKWPQIPPKSEMFDLLVDGKKINCIVSTTDAKSGFNLYFLKTYPNQPSAILSLSTYKSDPLAIDYSGKQRIARFPSAKNKKEKHRKPDDLIFGTSAQTYQSHAFMTNLSNISMEMENYFFNPMKYAKQLESQTKFEITDEDKKLIEDTIHSMMNLGKQYDGDFKIYVNNLSILITQVLLTDFKNEISNVKDFKIIRIPSKKRMIREINKRLKEKTITDFNQIEEIVINHLQEKHAIKNGKRILDRTGSREFNILSFNIYDDKGQRIRFIPMIDFFKKTKEIFTTMWPEIEEAINTKNNPAEKLKNKFNLFL